MKTMEVSVVIPAYNEEGSLRSFLPRVISWVGGQGEVIVVDDASTDGTYALAKELGARVIKNPYNMGNGAAVKRGIRQAKSDIIVLMDADGQHRPEDLPRLVEEMSGCDMVIGARRASSQAFWRKLANAVYNMLASYVSGMKIEDLTSGYRAIRRDKAKKFLYLLPNTFSYPTTLTLSFIKAAYPIKFVPVKVLSRRSGRSKINLISDGLRFLVIIMRVAVFFSPLKVFLPVSGVFFLTGMAYYWHTFVSYHRFTNMSALLFTTAVIIFVLGLISEQIVSLRMDKTDE